MNERELSELCMHEGKKLKEFLRANDALLLLFFVNNNENKVWWPPMQMVITYVNGKEMRKAIGDTYIKCNHMYLI